MLLLLLEAMCAQPAVGGDFSSWVVSQSLRPQSVPLAAVTSPGMDELRRFGPPRRDLLAGETVTSQGRSHESTSQTLEIPPAPPSPSCLPSGFRVPPGGTLKILSHLGKLSQGSLDSTPGLSAEFIVLFLDSGRSLRFWEPYGPIHVEREAILGSPIKSTLKLSSQKIWSAPPSSIHIIPRKTSTQLWFIVIEF